MTRARDLADSADKDIAGTLTLDGLTVDGTNGPVQITGSGYVINPTSLTLGKYASGRGYIQAPDNGALEVWDGGTNVLASFSSTEFVWNDGGANRDFRVESDANTHALFVDASANAVGIGTSSPLYNLHLYGAANQLATFESTDANANIGFKDSNTTSVAQVGIISNDLFFAAGGSERMRINSSGDVSFNGSSGDAATVKGNGTVTISDNHGSYNGGGLAFHYTGNVGYSQIYVKNNNTLILDADTTNTGSSTSIEFKVDGQERMQIDNSGRLLVNQTSVLTGGKIEIGYHGSSTFGLAFHPEIDNGRAINFKNAAGVTVGSIQNTSSATSYNTSSDYRLKEDVQPMTGASERVLALNPVNFAWKDGGDRTDGFIAHEAQAVVPEAVTGTKDAMQTEEYEVTPAAYDEDGNVVTEAVIGTREVPDYQGIDQSKLVPLLTAALQEALKRIEALEAKL